MTFYNKCVCILSALPYMCTACMPYICRYHCGYSFKCVIFLLFQGSINPRVHWPISLPVNCNKSSVQRTLQRSVVASVNSVVLLDIAFRGAKPKYPGGLDIMIRQKWCQKWDSDTVRLTSRTLWARWTPGWTLDPPGYPWYPWIPSVQLTSRRRPLPYEQKHTRLSRHPWLNIIS